MQVETMSKDSSPLRSPSLPTQATQPTQPTQATQPTHATQASQQKIWALAGGTMRVVSHGKKKPSDNYMVLQLEFSFDHDPRPRKVGKILFFSYHLFYNFYML
jgi:hypothetical protein